MPPSRRIRPWRVRLAERFWIACWRVRYQWLHDIADRVLIRERDRWADAETTAGAKRWSEVKP